MGSVRSHIYGLMKTKAIRHRVRGYRYVDFCKPKHRKLNWILQVEAPLRGVLAHRRMYARSQRATVVQLNTTSHTTASGDHNGT